MVAWFQGKKDGEMEGCFVGDGLQADRKAGRHVPLAVDCWGDRMTSFCRKQWQDGRTDVKLPQPAGSITEHAARLVGSLCSLAIVIISGSRSHTREHQSPTRVWSVSVCLTKRTSFVLTSVATNWSTYVKLADAPGVTRE